MLTRSVLAFGCAPHAASASPLTAKIYRIGIFPFGVFNRRALASKQVVMKSAKICRTTAHILPKNHSEL